MVGDDDAGVLVVVDVGPGDVADDDVAALFGLEMADVAPAAPQAPRETARIAKGSKRSAPKRTARKKVSATKAGPPRRTRNAAKRKNA